MKTVLKTSAQRTIQPCDSTGITHSQMEDEPAIPVIPNGIYLEAGNKIHPIGQDADEATTEFLVRLKQSYVVP